MKKVLLLSLILILFGADLFAQRVTGGRRGGTSTNKYYVPISLPDNNPLTLSFIGIAGKTLSEHNFFLAPNDEGYLYKIISVNGPSVAGTNSDPCSVSIAGNSVIVPIGDIKTPIWLSPGQYIKFIGNYQCKAYFSYAIYKTK